MCEEFHRTPFSAILIHIITCSYGKSKPPKKARAHELRILPISHWFKHFWLENKSMTSVQKYLQLHRFKLNGYHYLIRMINGPPNLQISYTTHSPLLLNMYMWAHSWERDSFDSINSNLNRLPNDIFKSKILLKSLWNCQIRPPAHEVLLAPVKKSHPHFSNQQLHNFTTKTESNSPVL